MICAWFCEEPYSDQAIEKEEGVRDVFHGGVVPHRLPYSCQRHQFGYEPFGLDLLTNGFVAFWYLQQASQANDVKPL